MAENANNSKQAITYTRYVHVQKDSICILVCEGWVMRKLYLQHQNGCKIPSNTNWFKAGKKRPSGLWWRKDWAFMEQTTQP